MSNNKEDKAVHMTKEELTEVLRPNLDEISHINKFYQDKTILITGGSGFVGKVLIEKLLRACPTLRRIYVLIRPKRDKNPDERLRQLFGSVLFDGIRDAEEQRLLDKVVAVEGDITRPLLGLAGENLDLIVKNVEIVLHSAAVVGFEQPLKKAIESNLIGVYNSIQLCLKSRKLLSMVYVSTAYGNCSLSSELDEHIYPVNVDPETLVKLTTSFDLETLELIKDKLLDKHPNTYTYTKCLAEWLCGQYVDRLPIVICRPSIITCTWREPIAGYLDNLNAGNGIYALVAKGLVSSASGAPTKTTDLIPVDTVANCIIALGWFGHLYHGCRKETLQVESDLGEQIEQFYELTKQKVLSKGIDLKAAELPVFHCSTGEENPIKLGKSVELILKHSKEYPVAGLFRSPSFAFTPNKWLNSIYKLVYHQLPAYAMDALPTFGLHGQVGGSNRVKMARRVDNFYRVISYFMLRQWKFNPENRLQLVNNFMSPADRHLFNCNVKSIDWDRFFEKFAIGIRRFMSENPGEDLDISRRRLTLIHWRDSILKLVSILCLCYLSAHCYRLTLSSN